MKHNLLIGVFVKTQLPRYLQLLTCLLLLTGSVRGQEVPASGSRTQSVKEVRVTDFGVRPDDRQDHADEVLAALAHCKKIDGATLVFPKGRYDFVEKPTTAEKYTVINVDGASHITLDGQGSTLFCAGRTSPIFLTHCKGVTIKNFQIDWERPPFSQGRVIKVAPNRKEFDVELDPEYPAAGATRVEAFMEYDPRSGRPLRAGVEGIRDVTATTRLGAKSLRVYLKGPVAVKPGVRIVLRHEMHTYHGITLKYCSDVRLENITIYTCPGMGLRADHCNNVNVWRLRVMPRPGSGRLMSSTADAAHFINCKGDIQIEDCLFEAMGDDGVAVDGTYFTVQKVIDRRTVTVFFERPGGVPPYFEPGDVVEFTGGNTLLPYAEGVVESAKTDQDTKVGVVRFVADLPPNLVAGSDLLADATWVPRSRISHCTVRGNRARGFIVSNRDALIEDNLFEYTSAAGIHVTCDEYWFAMIGTNHVVIRNNTFVGCNNGVQNGSAVINVFALLRGMKHAPVGVHQDVRIESNTIRDTDNGAIFVSSLDGAVIRDNRIDAANRYPTREMGDHAISLMNVRNVEVTGNICARSTYGARTVFVGPGCERQTVLVKDNR